MWNEKTVAILVAERFAQSKMVGPRKVLAPRKVLEEVGERKHRRSTQDPPDDRAINARRMALAAFALAGAIGAGPLLAAQADESRASVPPGVSLDGAPPIGGAIVGGSIQRSDKATTPLELERCRDLTGTLQAQCLRDARMLKPMPGQSDERAQREIGERPPFSDEHAAQPK
jgi:hypothetical protein